MIYKFKSKAAGDLIMTAPVGDQVLGLMGRSSGAKGIIEAASMPAAIAALEKAIADEAAAIRQAEADAVAEGQRVAPREGISLHQRAWPMVEMLKRASAENADIVWGV